MALSQRSFETEKGAAVIIDRDVKAVVPTVDPELANKYRSMQIPRRPLWDMKRSPEEQDRMERLDFLEWRRNVAKYAWMGCFIAQTGGELGRRGGSL